MAHVYRFNKTMISILIKVANTSFHSPLSLWEKRGSHSMNEHTYKGNVNTTDYFMHSTDACILVTSISRPADDNP